MKITAFKRFLSEQFQGAPEWFVNFLKQLNLLTEQLVSLTEKNISIFENADCQKYEFSIRAGATADANKTSFISTMKATPTIFLTGNVSNGYETFTSPVKAYCTVNGKTINVNSITGLTSGNTYKITLLIF